MLMKCLLGAHIWTGCKCRACGKLRDQGHDWGKDCEKCDRCGYIRRGTHTWDGCKCRICGNLRDEHHDWGKDCEKCPKCGKTRIGAHDWSKDCEKCPKCGETRSGAHDWGKDCEKCGRCGNVRDEAHDWEECKCQRCGKFCDDPFLDSHDWREDCEKCAKCGMVRIAEHVWEGPKCKRCSRIYTEDDFKNLLASLSDSGERNAVRVRAAEALAKIGETRAIEQLMACSNQLKSISGEPDWESRVTIAEAVGLLRWPAGEPLERCLKKLDAGACGTIPGSPSMLDTLETLIAQLADESPKVSASAARGVRATVRPEGGRAAHLNVEGCT